MQDLRVLSERVDCELVALARQNDNDAFGELVRRHYRRCIELATLFVRNHDIAEDQVQIACTKAHTRLHQFQGGCAFATWLSRIVTDPRLMFMRERRRAIPSPLDEGLP